MRFQNVKAEELEPCGPIKLTGFAEWARSLQNDGKTTSVLLAAPPGAGKGSAIGTLGETLNHTIVRCRLKQLLEYPDPMSEFKAMLQGTSHLQRTILWLDSVDRFLEKLTGGPGEGQQALQDWLRTERESLSQNHVMVVATVRHISSLPPAVVDTFDQNFAG